MKKGFLAILAVVVVALILGILISSPALARTGANSKVNISPPSGFVIANAAFTITVTESNTGNQDLSQVGVQVSHQVHIPIAPNPFDRTLNPPGSAQNPATSTSGNPNNILHVNETWTWQITGVVLPLGVTVVSAIGHGFDQGFNNITYPGFPDEYESVDLRAIDTTFVPASSNVGTGIMIGGITIAMLFVTLWKKRQTRPS